MCSGCKACSRRCPT
ncbi:MAG: hypothetical protein ACN6QA_30400 [Cupriavidus sp.]